MNREMAENRRIGWAAVLVLLLVVGGAWGKVIYVDDDAPTKGDGTSWTTAYRFLQDALTDAKAAGEAVEIRVAQGVYKPDRSAAKPEGGPGKSSVYFLLKNGMSLLGGYAGLTGADANARDIQLYQTTLSGDLLGNDAPVTDPAALSGDPTRDDNSLVVEMSGSCVCLEGCVVTGGAQGGGVWAGGAEGIPSPDVVIRDCVFIGNSGFLGGTLHSGAVRATGMTLTRCTFIENGGEIGGALTGYDLLVEDCRFLRNYARDWGGGGARVYRSTFINCAFIDNRTDWHGGALCFAGYPSQANAVTGCVFRRNSAAGGGGAIAFDGDLGELEVKDCLFVANEAAYRGGAGWQWGGDVILANCIFAGNRAGDHGAAWSSGNRDSLEVGSCTFSANRSGKGHYLVIDSLPHAAISNSILSSEHPETWNWGPGVELRYTCIRQGAGASSDPNMWLKWGPGNVEVDPCFVDAGYWDLNGTPDDPNDDFFVEGDYHLKSQGGRWDPISESWVQDDVTSPCIDAGDPNSPIGYEPFPNGGRINMGAYGGTAQASKSYFGLPVSETIIAGDIDGDGAVDFRDLALMASNWLGTGMQKEE